MVQFFCILVKLRNEAISHRVKECRKFDSFISLEICIQSCNNTRKQRKDSPKYTHGPNM
ncbi:hypothetical protein C0J52_21811 [Blattella germanica]|nr:hypothetical protein C0J52_21811 [Blattella germanica]